MLSRDNGTHYNDVHMVYLYSDH